MNRIEQLAAETSVASHQHLLSFFRGLDFQPRKKVAHAVQRLLRKETLRQLSPEFAPVVIAEALQRLGSTDFSSNPDATAALNQVLTDRQGTSLFIELVQRFHLKDRYGELLKLAQSNPDQQIGVEAIRALLKNKEWHVLITALRSKDAKSALATAQVMGNSRDGAIGGVLVAVVKDDSVSIDVRREALRAATTVNYAAQDLAKLYEDQRLESELAATLAAALHAASSADTREIANRLFPLPPAKEGKPLPQIHQLVATKGDVKNGRLVFNTTGTCHKCHVVNKIGREIGPDLSEIGSKLSRQAMFESIIFPSAGISHNYEAYTLVLVSGTTSTGLIISETDESIRLKASDWHHSRLSSGRYRREGETEDLTDANRSAKDHDCSGNRGRG